MRSRHWLTYDEADKVANYAFWLPEKAGEYTGAIEPAKSKPPAKTAPKVSDPLSTKCKLASSSNPKIRLVDCPQAFDKEATIKGKIKNIQKGNSVGLFFSGSRIIVHKLAHLWNFVRS